MASTLTAAVRSGGVHVRRGVRAQLPLRATQSAGGLWRCPRATRRARAAAAPSYTISWGASTLTAAVRSGGVHVRRGVRAQLPLRATQSAGGLWRCPRATRRARAAAAPSYTISWGASTLTAAVRSGGVHVRRGVRAQLPLRATQSAGGLWRCPRATRRARAAAAPSYTISWGASTLTAAVRSGGVHVRRGVRAQLPLRATQSAGGLWRCPRATRRARAAAAPSYTISWGASTLTAAVRSGGVHVRRGVRAQLPLRATQSAGGLWRCPRATRRARAAAAPSYTISWGASTLTAAVRSGGVHVRRGVRAQLPLRATQSAGGLVH
ncbi:hypothetical protein ACJJTC_006087 [Scirpophaga incertulas]